jgi:hypothetical protein
MPSSFSQKSHQRLPGVQKTKFPFFDKQVIFLWHNLTGNLPHCNFPNVSVKLLMRIRYLLLFISWSCSLAGIPARQHLILIFTTSYCSVAVPPAHQHLFLLFSSPSYSSAPLPALQHLFLLFSTSSCSLAPPPAIQHLHTVASGVTNIDEGVLVKSG